MEHIRKIFSKKPYNYYIFFGILLSLAPTAQQLGLLNSSTIIVLGTVIFYSVVGIGLNVLLGYSGLISLGTAGFMGLGSYMAAYLTVDMNLPYFLSVLISVSIPLVIGVIIGLISLRIEGYYLAIATLGVSEILKQVFIEMDAITGGFSGKSAFYPKIFGVIELNRQFTFIGMSIVLVLILIFSHNFINARTGRAFLTMRGSESAAKAMGINLLKYKLTAFGIATAYAALGGVLYIHFIRFAYPSGWSVTLSLQILAVIVIGGMRKMNGPVIGAFIVFGVPELILKQIPIISGIDGLAYIFTGLLIIVVILFYPDGVIDLLNPIKKYIENFKENKNEEKSLSNNQ